MKFAAIDVETANRRQRSICQVGVVVFDNGHEIADDVVLVDPQEEFESRNLGIHGISPEQVRGAMTFPAVHARLHSILVGHHVVSHHTFDRVAFSQASAFHGLTDFDCSWLDSCRIARQVWPHLAEAGGFGLANLATHFGISLRHHDAREDARACGQVLVRAMEETGTDLQHWETFCQPRSRGDYRGSRGSLEREGDGDGPLVGETVVLTGNFSVDKFDLADMAHIGGAAVRKRVTRETTMVVVGSFESNVGQSGKSSNLEYAERMAAAGRPVLIVTEEDLRELVRGAGGLA